MVFISRDWSGEAETGGLVPNTERPWARSTFKRTLDSFVICSECSW